MRPPRCLFLALTATLLATAGCREDRVVFVERNVLGEDLPDGAANFVGYNDPAARRTVCGECHVSQQAQWIQTAHADAFATLEAIPSSQAFCEDCHAVSEQGNTTTAAGGWTSTSNPRYHDVQCESCHGPGLEHATNPDGGTSQQMLAMVDAGQDMEGSCAECHSGYHHPFVEDWSQSGHGTVLASPAGRAECQGCHTGQGALRAFGVAADYVEKDSGEHLAITCAVCHDPHRGANEGQLRFSISVPDESQNLCMKCHHKRGQPDLESSSRGPHSPQGPLLLGEAGWWPPNLGIEPGDRIVGTHGSEANPRLCAGCHVQSYEVEDASGDFQFASTGHLFEAIPCLDGQGRPVPGGNCALSERTFRTCTNAGCHGSENAARSVLTTVRLRLQNLNDDLKAQIAKIPANQFSTSDGVYTVAEGARFNSQLADIGGTAVHNPFLMEALLIATIREVEEEYGVTAITSRAVLDARLQQVLTTARVTHGAAPER